MTDGLLDADEQLIGEVVGVVFSDTDTGFGVVELDAGDEGGARCSGPLASLVDGERVRLVGRWTTHARHGPTFAAVYYEQVTPTTLAGLAGLLATERFTLVSTDARKRVLAVFGADAGRVIEREPARLVDEGGLATDDADALHQGWLAGRALADLVRLVEPAGWPLEAARAVHAAHGAHAVRVLRDDPYASLEAPKVGFARADALARHLGVGEADPRRLAAAARAAVSAARAARGHQHLTRQEAASEVARMLRVDRLLADDAVDEAVRRGLLACEELAGDVVVSTAAALSSERQLAAAVSALQATVRSRLRWVVERDDLGRLVGGEATPDQRAAVATTFREPVSVLTGGPGTGKTTTVRAIVAAARERGLEVALAAPTGRAAKRLEEVVGHPATTIHRLLEARPVAEGFVFRHGPDEPLPHDLVVLDEVSMCDTALAASVVGAVGDGAHLLLVGDADQLPSVGPGDVLADLLRSEVVPVTELTQVHRQAQHSRIVGLAREVLEGRVPPIAGVDGDVFLAEEGDAARIVPRVVAAVAERAPEYFGVAIDDVQVLAPMYRGPAGVDALNAGLRAALNPPDGTPDVGGVRAGDRVMQTRNDPRLDVANGDIGLVVDVDARRKRLRIRFPAGEVTAPSARDLAPAWAVTVHKSQGGEWPVVVLVLDRSHRPMLWRNLVYTAVTRAQQALIIVGQHAALAAAAGQDRPSRRRTGLVARLHAASPVSGSAPE